MLNKWIIADVNKGKGLSLLQVGAKAFRGVSLRKNLSRAARLLLHDKMKVAVEDGIEFDETAYFENKIYRLIVSPIASPITHTPVGVVAIYAETESEIPPRPEIGAIEWEMRDGELAAYWDSEAASIYGRTEEFAQYAVNGVLRIKPNEWLTKQVGPQYQHTLQKLIEEATRDDYTGHGIISYSITDATTQEEKILELSAVNQYRGADDVRFLGMIRQIQEISEGMTVPEQMQEPQLRLDALFELTADIPLAQINCETGGFIQVLPGWTMAELADASQMNFYEMFSDESRERVYAGIQAAEKDHLLQVVKNVSMRSSRSGNLTVSLWVKALGDGYAMVRVVEKTAV